MGLYYGAVCVIAVVALTYLAWQYVSLCTTVYACANCDGQLTVRSAVIRLMPDCGLHLVFCRTLRPRTPRRSPGDAGSPGKHSWMARGHEERSLLGGVRSWSRALS